MNHARNTGAMMEMRESKSVSSRRKVTHAGCTAAAVSTVDSVIADAAAADGGVFGGVVGGVVAARGAVRTVECEDANKS
jgi:hypothetical protein